MGSCCICMVGLMIVLMKRRKYEKKTQNHATDAMNTDYIMKGKMKDARNEGHAVVTDEINGDCEEMYIVGKATKFMDHPIIETITPTSGTAEVCEDDEEM